MQSRKNLSREQEVILKFMETSINKINTCLSSLLVVEQILVEKKIIDSRELLNRIKSSRELPTTNFGKQILKEMLGESFYSNKNNLDKSV